MERSGASQGKPRVGGGRPRPVGRCTSGPSKGQRASAAATTHRCRQPNNATPSASHCSPLREMSTHVYISNTTQTVERHPVWYSGDSAPCAGSSGPGWALGSAMIDRSYFPSTHWACQQQRSRVCQEKQFSGECEGVCVCVCVWTQTSLT